jgi:predicted nuclease with TOPRIM domain
MISCDICYNDFKDYELITGGCCTAKICVECNSNIEVCPQCKKEYWWVNDVKKKVTISQLGALYKEAYENMLYTIHEMAGELNEMRQEKLVLGFKNEKLKDENNKLKEVSEEQEQQLESFRNLIVGQIKDDEYKKDMTDVICRYHLNLR